MPTIFCADESGDVQQDLENTVFEQLGNIDFGNFDIAVVLVSSSYQLLSGITNSSSWDAGVASGYLCNVILLLFSPKFITHSISLVTLCIINLLAFSPVFILAFKSFIITPHLFPKYWFPASGFIFKSFI
mgnify:CR=1 FL=1